MIDWLIDWMIENGILLKGVMIPNLLNNQPTSWFLTNLDFYTPQTERFDTSINLFRLVLLKLEFLFAVFFLQLTQYVFIVFI